MVQCFWNEGAQMKAMPCDLAIATVSASVWDAIDPHRAASSRVASEPVPNCPNSGGVVGGPDLLREEVEAVDLYLRPSTVNRRCLERQRAVGLRAGVRLVVGSQRRRLSKANQRRDHRRQYHRHRDPAPVAVAMLVLHHLFEFFDAGELGAGLRHGR